jgi:hypothetical protein
MVDGGALATEEGHLWLDRFLFLASPCFSFKLLGVGVDVG